MRAAATRVTLSGWLLKPMSPMRQIFPAVAPRPPAISILCLPLPSSEEEGERRRLEGLAHEVAGDGGPVDAVGDADGGERRQAVGLNWLPLKMAQLWHTIIFPLMANVYFVNHTQLTHPLA